MITSVITKIQPSLIVSYAIQVTLMEARLVAITSKSIRMSGSRDRGETQND